MIPSSRVSTLIRLASLSPHENTVTSFECNVYSVGLLCFKLLLNSSLGLFRLQWVGFQGNASNDGVVLATILIILSVYLWELLVLCNNKHLSVCLSVCPSVRLSVSLFLSVCLPRKYKQKHFPSQTNIKSLPKVKFQCFVSLCNDGLTNSLRFFFNRKQSPGARRRRRCN